MYMYLQSLPFMNGNTLVRPHFCFVPKCFVLFFAYGAFWISGQNVGDKMLTGISYIGVLSVVFRPDASLLGSRLQW